MTSSYRYIHLVSKLLGEVALVMVGENIIMSSLLTTGHPDPCGVVFDMARTLAEHSGGGVLLESLLRDEDITCPYVNDEGEIPPAVNEKDFDPQWVIDMAEKVGYMRIAYGEITPDPELTAQVTWTTQAVKNALKTKGFSACAGNVEKFRHYLASNVLGGTDEDFASSVLDSFIFTCEDELALED